MRSTTSSTLYQDQLFALVVRMVPDRDQASDCRPGGVLLGVPQPASFRGGSVKSWLNRICVNAAMDTQRAREARPVAAVSRARRRELAAACR
jgi:DNA-directed RNA polymerase specialized sigma24 family protein